MREKKVRKIKRKPILVLVLLFILAFSVHHGERHVEKVLSEEEKAAVFNQVWLKEYMTYKEPPKIEELEKIVSDKVMKKSGSWSLYVKNLDTGESFSINEKKMAAASLIKLFAMSSALEKAEAGEIEKAELEGLLTSMITVSDNNAFNSVVRKIGRTYISGWCKENGFSYTSQIQPLYPSSNNEGIATAPGRNWTSAKDCGVLLEKIYRGECVSEEMSRFMLGLLENQKIRWKIPAGVPEGIRVANKTGETDDVAHDTAIVFSPGADYILCIMVEDYGKGWAASGGIVDISKTVYNFFNDSYDMPRLHNFN